MSKYKCIIFDCDGVLVDSEPISNQILADMANELGANIDLDYARITSYNVCYTKLLRESKHQC